MAAAKTRSELAAALAIRRDAIVAVAAMSGLVNVLYLTGSFFMMEVYDRVIPSRSLPTLLGLAALALLLYAFQGVIEGLRSRILSRVGASLDARLSKRVFGVVARMPLKAPPGADGLQPVRDLDAVRGFMSGLGPATLFDLPWMPFYVLICALFHPAIGAVAAGGALCLVVLTFLAERLTAGPSAEATAAAHRRNALADSARRNAEVIAAMGMQPAVEARWALGTRDYMRDQHRLSDVSASLGTVSKIFRMALQSGVLALGAYLVIVGQASGGVVFASSLLVSRALAPCELAIAHWKGFVAARQAWSRLALLLERFPAGTDPIALPPARATLRVEGVSLAPPGVNRVVAHDLSLALSAGEGLGIIGHSASGKSSLAKAMVGIWQPLRGTVRLDGATLDQRAGTGLGGQVGYLPQEVDLMAGTIAENIARMALEPDAALVVAAAQAAGVHETILRLPDGYATRVGEGGAGISAGQRQRVGLARALYGDPFLVVLDEPNSNLDAEGEAALTAAILAVRARGGIAVVVAHRPSALAAVDRILFMAEGRVQAFGPKEETMRQVLRPAVPEPARAAAGARA